MPQGYRALGPTSSGSCPSRPWTSARSDEVGSTRVVGHLTRLLPYFFAPYRQRPAVGELTDRATTRGHRKFWRENNGGVKWRTDRLALP